MIERSSDRWVSIILSVVLHGTLVAALAYGFWNYRQERPTPTLAIEAEVVDARSVAGALSRQTTPQPPPPAPPPPVPQPTAPDEPPPPDETGPPEPTPEELAQREKAAAAKQAQEQAVKDQAIKQQAEQQAADKQRKLDQQKQQEEAQRQAAQKQREAQERADAERKALEAKKRDEQLRKDTEKRLADQRRAEDAQRQADEKARQERETDLRSSLAAEERADQARSSAAMNSWIGQITGRIKRAWLQPPTARPGIECLLDVTQNPGGQVLSATIVSCNGDEAVRESIVAAAYRASPLPPPPDPSLFQRELQITFRPN